MKFLKVPVQAFPYSYALLRLRHRDLAEAFTLREVDGFNGDEVCEILDITPNNLWVMQHRARALLRRGLETRWFAVQA